VPSHSSILQCSVITRCYNTWECSVILQNDWAHRLGWALAQSKVHQLGRGVLRACGGAWDRAVHAGARRTEACTDTSEGVSGLVGLGGPLDPGDGPLVIFLKFHQPFFYFHRVLKWLSHFLLQWLSYFFCYNDSVIFFILSAIFEISSRDTVAQPFFATLAQSFFKFCRPFFRFCRMLQWLAHFFCYSDSSFLWFHQFFWVFLSHFYDFVRYYQDFTVANCCSVDHCSTWEAPGTPGHRREGLSWVVGS
jgi:hypothetical protein